MMTISNLIAFLQTQNPNANVYCVVQTPDGLPAECEVQGVVCASDIDSMPDDGTAVNPDDVMIIVGATVGFGSTDLSGIFA